MRDNVVRALLAAHEADCKEDRERTRRSFNELETRITVGQTQMHAQNTSRFDRIDKNIRQIFFGTVGVLISVAGYLIAHLIEKAGM